MESKTTFPNWTEPQYLDERDHLALKEIFRLCEAEKFEEAMEYAGILDTIVREEIPGDLWLQMGGTLTKAGEEKLKRNSSI